VTCEQVLPFVSNVEKGFRKRTKPEAVLLDLLAHMSLFENVDYS